MAFRQSSHLFSIGKPANSAVLPNALPCVRNRSCVNTAWPRLMNTVAPMLTPEANAMKVAEQEIRGELQRVIHSVEFERAASLGRMVQYVVERTILGDY